MTGMPKANRRIRKDFGRIKEVIEIPDLIGMQRESYRRFLQIDVPPEKREEIGLQAVFKSVYPIKDFTGSASLEFVSYRFGKVKHSVEECIHRGMTYELPVRITVRQGRETARQCGHLAHLHVLSLHLANEATREQSDPR